MAGFKLRYSGSFVADAHQILHKGGIFTYPGYKGRETGKLRLLFEGNPIEKRNAMFDCRVWNVPTPDEVANYFVWREQDAARNSLQMLSRSHYSHRELEGKKQPDMHEMLYKKAVNWNEQPTILKAGSYYRKRIAPGELVANVINPLPVLNGSLLISPYSSMDSRTPHEQRIRFIFGPKLQEEEKEISKD